MSPTTGKIVCNTFCTQQGIYGRKRLFIITPSVLSAVFMAEKQMYKFTVTYKMLPVLLLGNVCISTMQFYKTQWP